MKLIAEQKMIALAHLGIASTIRGDEFVVHADKVPSDEELEMAYAKAVTPTPDPDEELRAAIEAASNFQELKDALLGKARSGRAAGRPV